MLLSISELRYNESAQKKLHVSHRLKNNYIYCEIVLHSEHKERLGQVCVIKRGEHRLLCR